MLTESKYTITILKPAHPYLRLSFYNCRNKIDLWYIYLLDDDLLAIVKYIPTGNAILQQCLLLHAILPNPTI